jgi:acyl-CoA synthetase (NDP forming)
MNAIEALLQPKSVAIIGASADETKTAGRPAAYLRRHGFGGEIWPVNPRATEIGGLRCFPDIASLPGAPDLGIVLLGAARAGQAVAELAARGTRAAIVLASGFSESGEEGAERQQALKKAAGSMRLLGPNTIGVVNLTDRIVLSASGALEIGDLPQGRISLVSQSGGILGSLLSRAADRGIGFARLVSTGNEADLDSADFIAHLADDPATDVIAVYMEGLRRPGAFCAAARKAAAAGKPIVVFKVGRSGAGARSATSHTGALAGADRMYDALFRQLGIIRAENFSELLDIPAALASGRRAKGPRVAIMTSTGGAGTLVADACGLAGIEVPEPDEATARKLGALLEGGMSLGNPVDVTLAGLKPELFRGTIAALLESESYDSVVVVAGSSALAQPSLAADAILECQARSEKPVLAYVSPHAPQVVAALNRRGIPAFAAPEAVATAIRAIQPRTSATTAAPAPARTAPALPSGAGSLNEAEAKKLFAHFGLPSVREEITAPEPRAAGDTAERLGGRVVLKALSREIAHKSELGAVAVGLTPEAVPDAAATMLDRLRTAGAPAPEGFLVQEMVTGGVEMILGLIRDPQLGPAVLLGLGGVATELFDDTALRLLPLTRQDAEEMVQGLKARKLLEGFRGAPPADVPALVDAILAFASMAEALGPRLLEAEVNPLFVLPRGRGVAAADGLAVLGAG